MAALSLLALGAAPAMAQTPPPANGQFDYQIGGAYTPLSSVAIVDRDRNDPPVAGKYNVCYVNAFQTQPDETSWWKANHPDLLLRKSSGGYVKDTAWGEILLDTSTPAKQAAIAAIVDGWIDGCRAAGYQAVEPDNLDSWTRSRRLLTRANNQALATLLASHAHAVGLAIAQKNAVEMAPAGKAIGFDFAIAEECGRWRECQGYVDTYGDQVLFVEYRKQDFRWTCNHFGEVSV
ncbi:MAG: endo alpha-1,4 polygalactosaminidase, partial [Conexibacter sp.]